MNFLARTSRRPIYVAMFFRSCARSIVPPYFLIPLFQSCLFVCQHPLANFSRFCWDCKGRNLFVIVKLFIFYFFVAFKLLLKSKPWQVSLLYTSFKILLSNPSLCFPSSEAGCKSRKKFNASKQKDEDNCIALYITPLNLYYSAINALLSSYDNIKSIKLS